MIQINEMLFSTGRYFIRLVIHQYNFAILDKISIYDSLYQNGLISTPVFLDLAHLPGYDKWLLTIKLLPQCRRTHSLSDL